MLRKALVIAAVLGFAAAAQPVFAATTAEEPKDATWSFEGPFGRFDQEQLQRGYKVYHDVCSSCHSMKLMSYRNLGQQGGPFYDPKYPNPNDNPYVKTLVEDFQVPDIDSDTGDVDQASGHPGRPLRLALRQRAAGAGVQRRRPAARPVADHQGAGRRPALRLFDPHRLCDAARRA